MISDNDLSLLVGKTLTSIKVSDDDVLFVCDDDSAFHAYHLQDCCESVDVHDVSGDPNSLIGWEIVEAEETFLEDWPADVENFSFESWTWTVHRIKVASGSEVIIRWIGQSNGYYGETVYFSRTHKPL